MKRNLHTIEKILTHIEQMPFDGKVKELAIPGLSDEELAFHFLLLVDAGLIDAQELNSKRELKPCNVYRLTWSGCEYLDSAHRSKPPAP